MSALLDIYIKKDTLAVLLYTVQKKGENGVAITINCDDKTNHYGQNVSAWVSQTKEQREAKTPRYYVGNGKVHYVSEAGVTKAERKQESGQNEDEKLPF